MSSEIRHDWTFAEVEALFQQSFIDTIYQAQTAHRRYFNPNEVQLSSLLSVKTGTCPENCGYCSQSGHFKTGLQKESLMSVEQVIERAKKAKAQGATRFCMGAAWRSPPKKDFPKVLEMIKAVNALGLESCVTLGMLDDEQAEQLKEAGLDFYNHNIDTSPEYYQKMVSTRTFQDRLDTLEKVRKANINVCCGGIVGMGETHADRVNMLVQLANLPEHPGSVPINQLMPVPGTPLGDSKQVDPIEFIKTIAVAKILMPRSFIRLSAGREMMSDEMQALCFLAGANSIFVGDVLLTTPNPSADKDSVLLSRLGIKAMDAVPTAEAV